jgi:hypothetical protein
MPSCHGRQRWHFGDLVLIHKLPEDPWWPVRLGAPDGLVRVRMISTRKSWMVSGRGSSTTWSGWTVVASTVLGRSTPASTKKATSRSENPPPLPIRAPWRFTATLPHTTGSAPVGGHGRRRDRPVPAIAGPGATDQPAASTATERLQPLVTPVDRAGPGHLAAAGRLGDEPSTPSCSSS